VHVSSVDDPDHDLDGDAALPRSPSATSSLDPYYFGVGTPRESPVLPHSPSPAPAPPGAFALKTPELGPFEDPVTPHRNPAAIDRRGLVGVGELATPRWARGNERGRDEVEVDEQLDEDDEEDEEGLEGYIEATGEGEDKDEPDLPDSPWTIEAIDGEPEDTDEVCRGAFLLGWCLISVYLLFGAVSRCTAAIAVTSVETLDSRREWR
jgi:dual specificity tyrosine-phosphorylation-regulated kinase 2/3/4